MRLWLLLIGALIVQEIATTNIVLLSAHRAGYSGLLIALIFVLATAFDLAVGYLIGKYVQRRFAGSKLVTKAATLARRFERYLGRYGARITLLLLGFVSYAYVNSFLASWLELPAEELMLWLFLGDLGWYALEWLLVLGTRSVSSSLSTELYISVGISILFIATLRLLSSYIFKRG